MRRRRKSAQRNSLNGVVSLAKPPARSIQVTVDIYGHAVPGGNRAAVDRLHDAPFAAPNVTPAAPEGADEDHANPLSAVKSVDNQNYNGTTRQTE